ncbi:MAG: cell division protein FtsX [Candidatus Krumholzibacteriia bacterium]
MSFHQLAYLARESVRTLRRHKGIMSLSIIIMSLSLLVLAVFLLATDNVTALLDKTVRDFRVYVYLEDGMAQETIEEYHRALFAMDGVETIQFVSKAEALLEFREELGAEQYVLETLRANPLPASFRVTLKGGFADKDRIETFAREVGAMGAVEEVNYGKDFMERFSFLARIFMYVDAVLGGIVVLSSVFIISNTVRLTILSRRRSIEILKLVGATNLFITTPFIMEGAFQGGLASMLSLGMLVGIYVVCQNILPDVAFLAPDRILLYVATCVGLGALGSYAALRRFLKL